MLCFLNIYGILFLRGEKMSDFLNVMKLVINFLKRPFSLYGFTFSLWDVVILIIITSIIVSFIRSVYGD